MRPSAVALSMLFLASSSLLSTVNCFTAIPSHVVRMKSPRLMIQSIFNPIVRLDDSATTSLSTSLHMKEDMNEAADTGGIGRGKVLLLLVLIVNVWMFSIPVEFRRARLCSVEDTKLYPDKHCTTVDAWRTGVADYYANGGGIKFDFSIEGKE